METVNLAVIDPNGLFRAGLVSLLSAAGFPRVDQAESLADMKRLLTDGQRPDIVLIDLQRNAGDIEGTITSIGAFAPSARVVFLANDLDVLLLGSCFAAGASGFLLKDISCYALQESLHLVSAGEKVFPSGLAHLVAGLATRFSDPKLNAAKLRASKLSDREIEILRFLAYGQPNKVIAANLDIAESTVKVHLKSILRKTSASNRTQAAIWALEQGLADPDLVRAPVSGMASFGTRH